jgi:hypothetical protein
MASDGCPLSCDDSINFLITVSFHLMRFLLVFLWGVTLLNQFQCSGLANMAPVFVVVGFIVNTATYFLAIS